MAIQAQLYDGTTLEFPDGTDPSVIEATAKRITQERRAASAKPEEVGFFEAIPAAARRGVEQLGEVATGLGIAAKKATGDTEGIRQVMAEAKKEKPEEKPGMTVTDFERIAKEQGFAAAAAQAPKYIVEQVLQSAPQMAGPLAVGVGAAALSGPFAPIVGPVAGIATYGVQQFGNFLMRQAREKQDPQELEIAKAALTAGGTAPIGYFADRFATGLSSVGKNTGEEVLKELAARRAAGEIGAGAVGKEVAKRAGKGATVGIIAEAPTEVLEQAAERYQAGLDLDSDEAKNEYREAFFGAAAAGGGIGGISGGARGYAGYRGELAAAQPPAPPAPPAVAGEAPPPPPPPDGDEYNKAFWGEDTYQIDHVLEKYADRYYKIEDQINQAKAFIKDIAEADPNDERIEYANQRIASLQDDLVELNTEKEKAAEIFRARVNQNIEQPTDQNADYASAYEAARQEFAVRGQMGFDFDKEPEKEPVVYETGAFIPSEVKGEPPKASAGFRTLGADNDLSSDLAGATLITGMDVADRNRGTGTKLLNSITNWADENGKTLALIPAAQPDEALGGLNQQQLKEWYARNGFEDRVDYMVREPKPKEAAPEFELTGEGRVPEMQGIEEVPEGERARLMLVGTPGDPTKPIRSLFDSLKPASANPAESVKFKGEVRKFLDDINEFVGGKMRKEVSRFRETDAQGRPIGPPPEPPKGPDVGVPLSGPELNRRMQFLNNFFDSLSIAPKERETLTSALSQQIPNMPAKQQAEVLGALTKMKNINTRQGMEKLREMFNTAVDRFERGRIGEAEAALPFRGSEDLANLDPYIAAAVGRAIKSIDKNTPEGKAAMAYLNADVGGWRYGLAMRSAAFDIGVPIDDFSGVSFRGQNTEQANLFKEWIKDNLPQQEYNKFEATVKEFREMNRRANQAMNNANKRKASGIDPSYLKSLYRKPTGKEEVQAIPAGMKGKFTSAGETKVITGIQFAMMHPSIQDRIENNDIKGALQLIASQKLDIRKPTREAESRTYTQFISGLAKRLLEVNLTTDIVVNQQNKLNKYFIEKNARAQRTQFLQQLESFDWGKDFIAKHNLRGDLADPNVVRQTLRVLQDIADNKITFGKDDVIPPIAGQFAQLLKTYRDAVANLDAKGFFFSGQNVINMNTERGGMTTATFLHEVVHAATLHNLLPQNYNSLTPAQKMAVDEIKELYQYAKDKYAGTAAGSSYGFESVPEFVSEALSNPDFQEFLQVLKYETKYKGGKALSLWDKFIGLIGKLFGLDNVLGKTIANVNAIMRASAKTDDTVIAYNNAGKSIMAGTMPYNSSQYMGLMNTILNGRLTWSGVKDRLRNVYVGALTLRQLSDIMSARVPKIKEFINTVENMLEYRNNILEEVKNEIRPWQEFQSKDPAKAQLMSKLMIDTTVAKKDPSKRDANGNFVKTGDANIDKAWQEIGPEGRKVYESVKLFYKRRYDSYVDMILENKKLALMADGFSQAEALANPEYTSLKKHFQDQSIEPYFPLRRFGDYSVRLMSGKNRSFYMFESPEQRDAFIKTAIPLLEKKYGKNFNPEQDIVLRNGSRDLLYSENLQSSQSLSTLKDLIKTTPADDVMGLRGPNETTLRDNLTKAVEDLYLLQIPDQSIRKMFMNRENIPGMDLDMLRAFTSSAFHMAYQHSRFKFSRPLYNSLDAASTQVNELDREEGKVMSEYLKEIKQHRVNYIMNPVDTGQTAARLSNLSFLWFMTSPASAITNMLGVPAVGFPVLGAKFGNAKALATIASYSKKVMSTGFKDQNGKFATPSLSNNLSILSEAQLEAYLRAVADGIIDITLTHDIVGLAETPSALYQEGAEQAVMKYASFTFHGAEKFNREVIFMSSFDMAYQQYKAKGYNEEGARKKAIEIAKDLTYKSMFDYSTLNKPRYFQGSAAKVILQFKQFSQQMTYLLTRSAFETIYKDFSPSERALIRDQIKAEDRAFRTEQPRMTEEQLDAAVEKYIADFRREARSRLLGVYGTTAVFAGATGLPLWWMVSSTANALQAVFGDEEDEDWDFDIWFKEWANETFGGFFGDVMARGAVSQLTGANVANRLSLNDLWFRDTRKSQDEISWVQNQLINLLGPTAGLVVNSAEAVKQYNQGYLDRAIETASPAVIKNALKGLRLYTEGRATNLKGDELVGDITGLESIYQTIGFSPERVAQQQKVNIERKTIEQDILKRGARLKDAFFMAVDNDDNALLERTLDKLMEFNARYPELSIDGDDLIKSVRNRYERRALAESMGGMTFDKRLIGRLSGLGE